MSTQTDTLLQAPLPLAVPQALANEQARIIESFRDEHLDVSIVGIYSTKSTGPVPSNFWIDLAHHAETFPLEHFLDGLELAVGAALLRVFDRITARSKVKAHINLMLPTKGRGVNYIIPESPNDKLAVKAITKHYKSLDSKAANEYFWTDNEWISAEQHFARKRAGQS